MTLKSLVVATRIRLPVVLCGAFIICVLSFDCAAQTERREAKRDRLPRVGTIKDYPATGLMTACGNLYFYPASQTNSSTPTYVFLARGDGSNAWMNLGGRDQRLRQTNLLTRDNRKLRQFSYRIGELRVSVLIESFKAENRPGGDEDFMFKMKITLRKGRAVRIVRAVGSADC